MNKFITIKNGVKNWLDGNESYFENEGYNIVVREDNSELYSIYLYNDVGDFILKLNNKKEMGDSRYYIEIELLFGVNQKQIFWRDKKDDSLDYILKHIEKMFEDFTKTIENLRTEFYIIKNGVKNWLNGKENSFKNVAEYTFEIESDSDEIYMVDIRNSENIFRITIDNKWEMKPHRYVFSQIIFGETMESIFFQDKADDSLEYILNNLEKMFEKFSSKS